MKHHCVVRTLVIDYYSDLLCVWAWVAQRRIDELHQQFGERIELNYRYIDVFGDTRGKMERQWQARGGFDGFATHVQESAAAYECAPVNPAIWHSVRPATSAMAHLLLRAVELTCSAAQSASLALRLRQAFFVDAVDIGDRRELLSLAAGHGLDEAVIARAIEDGSAMAALMRDYQGARELALRGSPSFVLDGGRQILFGNVGYRVLHANVEELLHKPANEASWC